MAHTAEDIDEPTPPTLSERGLAALLPMLIAIASGTRNLAGTLQGDLVNPDSYMRMVRLEETLRQHDIAYTVARDGSGSGTLLHWTHLIDLVLCALAAPLRPFLGAEASLDVVAAAFGPLCLAALGLALLWAVTPLAERRWRWLAPVVATLSAPIAAYGLPGVVHHHVPLLVVAVMTAGYAVRGALGFASGRAGLAMGAWAGVGIWLSPESMPFTLMALGGLWLAWALSGRHDLARMIQSAAAGFLLVVAAALAADPPQAGHLAVEVDRLSVVYLGLASAFAIAALTVPRLSTGIAVRLGVPVLCLAAWLALFPAVASGPDGLMGAQETQAMFGGISEMMPVRDPGGVLALLLTGGLTACVLAWWAGSRRSLLLAYAALCACVLVGLGAVHMRFAAYPATAAAAMLPLLLTRCTAMLRTWPEAVQSTARVGLMALFALVPRAEGLPGLFSQARAAGMPTCDLASGAGLLRDHAGDVVLADPSASPELLYRTGVLTVGSLYHRNPAGFMRLRAAWRSPPGETIPDAVRATGATLVLFCPAAGRSLLVADLPPDTLLDRLNRGQVPPWLHRLGEDPRSGNILYGVMQ
ncbi:MAG: hypothetical protein WDN25_05430 [Acetobacteraceae bacterium]